MRGFSVQRVFVTLPEGHALARSFVAISTDSLVSLACVNNWHDLTFGTLVFLPKEAIYLGTHKHYSVVSVHREVCAGPPIARLTALRLSQENAYTIAH